MISSIKGKILASQIVSIMSVCLLSSIFGYNIFKAHLKKAEMAQLNLIVKYTANEIEEYFENQKKNIYNILDSKEFEDYVNRNKTASLIHLFSKYKSDFPILSLIDESGKEMVNVSNGFESKELTDYKDSEFYKKTREVTDKVHIFLTEFSPGLNANIIKMTIGKEYYPDSPIFRMILGQIPINFVTRKISEKKIGETGFVVILRNDGLIISHSKDSKLIGTNFFITQKNLQSIDRAMKSGSEIERMSIFGMDSYIAFTPIKGKDWMVFSVLPYSEFSKSIYTLQLITAGLFFSMTIVWFGIAILMVRKINKPLTQLTKEVIIAASGEFSREVNINSHDQEIIALSKAFNKMKQDLGKTLVSKGYVEKIIGSMLDTMVIVNNCGVIVKVNPSTLETLNYQDKELIGKNIEILFEDKNSTESLISLIRNKIETDRHVKNIEAVYISKNSIKINMLLSCSMIKKQNDNEYELIIFGKDITERINAEKKMSFMAYYDSLTGLPNRLLLKDRLKKLLSLTKRKNYLSAIMFLDLDNFKHINDTLGHDIGDKLLQSVVDRVKSSIRDHDTLSRPLEYKDDKTVLSRLGGDEFTILLTDMANVSNSAIVAQRILDILGESFTIGGFEVFVSISIGIAVIPNDGEDVNTLLRNADTAMYKAKSKGKNTYCYYNKSMNKASFQRLTLEKDLRKALEADEFFLCYQPKMDLKSNIIVGAEALVRWIHPEKGLVMPSDFIPLAEETGLIMQLGELTLKKACRQNKDWQNMGYDSIVMSVNLSAQQFNKKDLFEVIQNELIQSGLGPEYLELEITETIVMENLIAALLLLKKLKNLGIKISMDDFGTGYSSFSNLTQIPLDIVKIDRSFIKDMHNSKNNATVVDAIIAMTKRLNLETVAEGVDNIEHVEMLKKMGCRQIQGYLISPPVPADEFIPFLTKKGEKKADYCSYV